MAIIPVHIFLIASLPFATGAFGTTNFASSVYKAIIASRVVVSFRMSRSIRTRPGAGDALEALGHRAVAGSGGEGRGEVNPHGERQLLQPAPDGGVDRLRLGRRDVSEVLARRERTAVSRVA